MKYRNQKARLKLATVAMHACIIKADELGLRSHAETAEVAFNMADAMLKHLELEAQPALFRSLSFATAYEARKGCTECPNEVVGAYTEIQDGSMTRRPVCNKHALDLAGDWELHDDYQRIHDADFPICYPETFEELTTWICDGSPCVTKAPGIKGVTDAH